jgi:hypothetical protein
MPAMIFSRNTEGSACLSAAASGLEHRQHTDTPGYKAVDIDIEEAAQIVKGASGSLPLATTATSHHNGGVQAPPFPLKYHVPYQTAADGNTVKRILSDRNSRKIR